jgi:hypothetical protein
LGDFADLIQLPKKKKKLFPSIAEIEDVRVHKYFYLLMLS